MARRVSMVRAVLVAAFVALPAGCSSPAPAVPSSAASGSTTSNISASASTSRSTATTPGTGGKSVVGLGHSGMTGYDSNPDDPNSDDTRNSWVTGTTPEVDSIYSRLSGQDPAYLNHTGNFARSGSTVDDLLRQSAEMAELDPAPGIVFIQTLDNDIRCDGTDEQNFEAFGAEFRDGLDAVLDAAPDAQIYVVSPWATVQNYADAIADLPDVRASAGGDGPCAMFDSSGAQRPDGIAYLQAVIDGYSEQLAEVCAQVPGCRYDGGASKRLVVTAADLSADGNHLNVTGLARYAELMWLTFFAG